MPNSLEVFVKNFDKIDEIKEYLSVLAIDLARENDESNYNLLQESFAMVDRACAVWAHDMLQSLDGRGSFECRLDIVDNLLNFSKSINKIFSSHSDLEDLALHINNQVDEVIDSAVIYKRYSFEDGGSFFNEGFLRELRSKLVIITAKI